MAYAEGHRKEKQRNAQARYRERHPYKGPAYQREYYAEHSEQCKKARREYYLLNREQELANNAEYYRRIRREVIAAYGGRCACCEIDIYEFLTFDHIAGQADKPRGQKEHGNALWMRLRREGFPRGEIQILCWNCNEAKAHYGVCPHQLRRSDVPTDLPVTSSSAAALC